MRGNKPFTNITFTKRVDKDSGRHRPPRAKSEPAVCKECGAVYAKRRWTAVNLTSGASNQRHPVRLTVCPACKQKNSGEPRGFVFLDGAFFVRHQERSKVCCGTKPKERQKTMRWREFSGGSATTVTNLLSLQPRSIWRNVWAMLWKRHSVERSDTTFRTRTSWLA